MSVHFKFKAAKDFDTVSFSGSFISVGELKRAILTKKKMTRSTDFDLEIVNAQTNEGASAAPQRLSERASERRRKGGREWAWRKGIPCRRRR